MNNLKIVPVPREKKSNSPSFWAFLALIYLAFLKLEKAQRMHVLAVFACIVIPSGLCLIMAMDRAATVTVPKYVITVKTPANLTVDAPEVEDDDVGEDEPIKIPFKRPKHNAAPRDIVEVAPASAEDYIRKYAPFAQRDMTKFGVPASISLAQGLVESNAGKSFLAINAKNHFGMKCFSKTCKKGHCINAPDDTHKDFFRCFKSVAEAYDEHGAMISSGRYAKLKRYGRDYKAWANGLKSVGYATDRSYASKLIGIIQRYHLDRYDSPRS